MVIVKKFTTFRPNNLKINEPRQMYSEHKNAGKGRVMLGETFKELKATDPSLLKIDTWKDYKLP